MPEEILEKRPQQSNKSLMWVIAILLVLVIATGAFIMVSRDAAVKDESSTEQSVEAEDSTAEVDLSSAADETADWKTYTNDDYGFTFKYPDDWILGLIDHKDNAVVGIGLTSPEMQELIKAERPDSSPDIYIKVFTKPDNFSLKNFIENDKDYTKNSIAEYTVARSNGYEATFGGMVDEYFVLWENDNNYFEASTCGSTENRDNILATFQFTK